MATPIERYRPSHRPYQPNPEPFGYGPDDKLRRVQQNGHISFGGHLFRLPKAFRGKTVALRTANRDGLYNIVFRTTTISTLDLNDTISHP